MLWIRGIVKPGRSRNNDASEDEEEQQDVRQLQAEEIRLLGDVPGELTSAVEVRMKTDGLSTEALDMLKAVCAKHPGACDLVLRLQKSDREIFVQASNQFKVEPSEELVQDLTGTITGVDVILSNRTARVQSSNQRAVFV